MAIDQRVKELYRIRAKTPGQCDGRPRGILNKRSLATILVNKERPPSQ
jgi:hypothetical protein